MRRSRGLIGVGAAVVVGILGVVGAGLYLTLRDNARPVTVEEVRARTTTTGDSGPEVDDGHLRPPPGIYRYEGSGTERLSTPPLSQTQGPEMPATVEWLEDGCWTQRIDYSSNHWQRWNYCPIDGGIAETGGETWQRWMIGVTAITNLSTFRCDEAVTIADAPEPGQEWEHRCIGTSEAVDGEVVSAGPLRFDGEELIDVGGTDVRTARYVRERSMSGAQVGTDRSTTWFDVDSGLAVRNERSIELRTDTPIGESTYTETAEFRLVALDPV